MNSSKAIYFGPYRLLYQTGSLYCADEEVILRPKALAVLSHLLSHPGELMTKDALLAAAWPNRVVSDVVLTVCIREIRQALGDNPHTPQYVQTVHGRGYRFIGELRITDASPAALGTDVILGRERELQTLHTFYKQAVDGQRQLVFISGEPGIGKTSLIDIWAQGLGPRQQSWMGRGQCIEHRGAGEAYLPLLEALSQLHKGPQSARVIAALRRYAPNWVLELPALIGRAGARCFTLTAARREF